MGKLKIKPVGEYILVETIEESDTTASGLIIQTSNKSERPQKGKIIALGGGRKDDNGKVLPFNVKVSDVILFKKYSPEEVEIDNKQYLLMKEADILAIIEG